MLYIFIKLEVEIDLVDAELIPKPDGEMIPWQGFEDLRKSLMQRGMIKEAMHVYRAENNRTPFSKRFAKFDLILQHLRAMSDLHNRAFLEAELMLDQVDTYVNLNDIAAARKLADQCELQIDNFCTNYGSCKEQIPTYINLQYVLLPLLPASVDKVTLIEKLVLLAKETLHRRYVNLLDVGAETCLQLGKGDSAPKMLQRYYAFREEGEYVHEHLQEDLNSLAIHHTDVSSVARSNLVDRQKELVSSPRSHTPH